MSVSRMIADFESSVKGVQGMEYFEAVTWEDDCEAIGKAWFRDAVTGDTNYRVWTGSSAGSVERVMIAEDVSCGVRHVVKG